MSLEQHLNKWFDQCHQVAPARLAGIDRKKLITYFHAWEMKNGAEIGVDRGRYSEYMLKTVPGLKLLCVDLWWWRFNGESRLASAKTRLDSFPNAKIVRDFSMNAVRNVPDNSLDFVYIDANHEFDFVMQDIIEWSKKVKLGGLVAGHDYYGFRGGGVIDAVNAYTKAHGITQWFITDEKTPTWFWRKIKNYPWEE